MPILRCLPSSRLAKDASDDETLTVDCHYYATTPPTRLGGYLVFLPQQHDLQPRGSSSGVYSSGDVHRVEHNPRRRR